MRDVAGHEAREHVHLPDELEGLADLEAGHDAEPVIEPRVLPERVAHGARVGERGRERGVEREALHPVHAQLVLAVNLGPNESLLGREHPRAAVVEGQACEVIGLRLDDDGVAGARRGGGGNGGSGLLRPGGARERERDRRGEEGGGAREEHQREEFAETSAKSWSLRSGDA